MIYGVIPLNVWLLPDLTRHSSIFSGFKYHTCLHSYHLYQNKTGQLCEYYLVWVEFYLNW